LAVNDDEGMKVSNLSALYYNESPAQCPYRQSDYSHTHQEERSNSVRKLHRGHIQAVLFDCDGVVVDSESVHEHTLMVASERLGHQLIPAELQQLKGRTQQASAEALKALIPSATMDCKEIIEIRAHAFDELFDQVRLVPGVLKFIRRLRTSGFSVALTTGSGGSGLASFFDRFSLSSLFDVGQRQRHHLGKCRRLPLCRPHYFFPKAKIIRRRSSLYDRYLCRT
jgi:Haloacid dehalogenase-like hydrolase